MQSRMPAQLCCIAIRHCEQREKPVSLGAVHPFDNSDDSLQVQVCMLLLAYVYIHHHHRSPNLNC